MVRGHFRDQPEPSTVADVARDSEAAPTGTVDHVRSWLRESGYPLEMRTAATFRANAFGTESARHYVAEDESTLREIDVVATSWKQTGGSNSWVELVIVAECKSSRKHPWVAFLGDDSMSHDDDILWLMRVDAFGPLELDETTGNLVGQPNRSMLKGLHHMPPLFSMDKWAYAITEAKDDSSNAYNAVRQVGSAVDGYARDAIDRGEGPVLRVTVPVVVTSAPLVTCWLDEQGSEELAEVDRVLLVTRLRPAAELAGVWIVQESGLDAFVQEARAGLTRLFLDTSEA